MVRREQQPVDLSGAAFFGVTGRCVVPYQKAISAFRTAPARHHGSRPSSYLQNSWLKTLQLGLQ